MTVQKQFNSYCTLNTAKHFIDMTYINTRIMKKGKFNYMIPTTS